MFIQLLGKYPVAILMLFIFMGSLGCGLISIRTSTQRAKWYLSILKMGYIILPLMGVVGPCPGFIYALQALASAKTVEVDKSLLYSSLSNAIVFIQTGIWMGIILLILHSILSARIHK